MKKNKLFVMVAPVILSMALFAGCDQNIPEMKEVAVESVEINDAQLAAGVSMEAEKTLNISWKVVVSPANATDRVENYSSDNTSIATVNQRGLLKALSVGQTRINITVGGKTAGFDLTVTPKIVIQATDLRLPITEFGLALGLTYDLASRVILTPSNANDGLIFESDNEDVVTVTAEGLLRGVAIGTANVTVTSKGNPSLTATLTVNVSEFSGWYPRTDWTMDFSQSPLPSITDCGQGVAAAIDDNSTTNLALVRPGKNTGGYNLSQSDDVWFVIDMKQAQVVNAFRIIHRTGTNIIQTRWWGFDYIYGSNDTTENESERQYSEIASNVLLPSNVSDTGIPSHDVKFDNTVAYRYIKFYAQTVNCFYQNSYTSAGLTAQIQEIYLGLLTE